MHCYWYNILSFLIYVTSPVNIITSILQGCSFKMLRNSYIKYQWLNDSQIKQGLNGDNLLTSEPNNHHRGIIEILLQLIIFYHQFPPSVHWINSQWAGFARWTTKNQFCLSRGIFNLQSESHPAQVSLELMSWSEGRICSSDRYMINLYCLVVQVSFYRDMVECSPVTHGLS